MFRGRRVSRFVAQALALAVVLGLTTTQALIRAPEPAFASLVKLPLTSPGTVPELLASLPEFVQEGFGATVTSESFVLTEDAGGFAWGVGYGLFHTDGDANIYNFTAQSDPTFPHMAALLTNGIDDSMAVYDASNLGGGSGSYGNETGFFGANPDFIGNAIDSIALVIHDLHIFQQGGLTWVFSNYTWQVWGHPLFVYFTPSTDAEGAYIFQRNSSNVSVYLRSPGTAVVNWDGTNLTMMEDGQGLYVNVTGLANGNHTFRVWATDNSTVTLHATEPRTITFGYHVWAVERVTRARNPSLALDSNGTIHACYGDYGGGIHIATRNATGWQDTIVDGVSSRDSGCSLVLDPKDRPYASYGSLKFGFFDGTAWRSETVSTTAEGLWSSIAINPLSGTPMIAYYDKDARALFLANRSNGVWSREVVDSGGDTGWMPSLAIDVQGNPHIAYFDATGRVEYAVQSGGSWTIQTIDDIGPLGGIHEISLALDSSGNPSVSYVGGGSFLGADGYGGIKYADWTGSAWEIQNVDAGPANAVSLVLDPLEHPRIAYSLVMQVSGIAGLHDVRYASWNGTWAIQTVSHSVDSGGLALALTSAGMPVIAFPYWCCLSGLDELALDFAAQVPLADFEMTPTAGNLSTVFTFDPSATWDPFYPASSMQTRWDFTGDGVWDTGWSPAGPIQHQFAAAGVQSVVLQVRDPSGLTAEQTKHLLLGADAEPHFTQVTISGAFGNAGWYVSSVTLTLNSSDNVTGVRSIFYSLDNASWADYSAPLIVATTGTHALEYYSTDNAGNAESVRTLSFKSDVTGPIVQANLSGILGDLKWYLSAVQVTLTASDVGSGVAFIAYHVDGGSWQTYGGPFAIATEGNHTLVYRPTDVAGNMGAEAYTIVRLDATPPRSSVQIKASAGSTGWYVSNATVTLTAIDAPSGVASISYRVDGGSWLTYASPFMLENGVHALDYRAIDEAGNVETIRTQTIKVDTVAPTLSRLSPSGLVTTSLVTFSWTGTDTGSGIVRYDVGVDGAPFQSVGLAANTSLTLGDGVHEIRVRAVDTAGNAAEIVTSIRVDTNMFSFTGPYSILPALLVIGTPAAALTLWAWRRRKRRKLSP